MKNIDTICDDSSFSTKPELELYKFPSEMTDTSLTVDILPALPAYDGSEEVGSNGFVVATDVQDKPSESEIKAKSRKNQLRNLLAGVALTLMSALFSAFTSLIVKYATDITAAQMALFRYVGIWILSFPVMVESKQPWFGQNNWSWRMWMLLRGLSGGTSVFFRFTAVTYISLADTTIIMLAMPAFVFIFARIFLREQFGRYHVLALLLSVVGIAFTSKIEIFFKPGALDDEVNTNATFMHFETVEELPELEDHHISSTAKQLIGTLYALGSMFIGSLVYITVRKLQKTHHSVILFNFALISMVEMALINLIFYDFHLPTSGISAYLVPVLAVLSFYAQLLLTKAIQMEEAGVVSVVRVSSEAFFAIILQIVFFQEIPDFHTIIGAILVLCAVFLLSFRKYIIGLQDEAPLKKKFQFLTK